MDLLLEEINWHITHSESTHPAHSPMCTPTYNYVTTKGSRCSYVVLTVSRTTYRSSRRQQQCVMQVFSLRISTIVAGPQWRQATPPPTTLLTMTGAAAAAGAGGQEEQRLKLKSHAPRHRKNRVSFRRERRAANLSKPNRKPPISR